MRDPNPPAVVSDEVTHTAADPGAPLDGTWQRPRPGALVDRFVLLKAIGEGGMGSVWAAYDGELDRKVAIKLVRAERAFDEHVRARMLREAQALARLAHPNVVTVYEVGIHDQQIYLAMEYVEGETLKAWLQRQPIGAAERVEAFLDLVRQAGRGLAAAHAAGLVHRDFKPANVIVGADGRVRVVDFGLARTHVDADPIERDVLVSTYRDEALRSGADETGERAVSGSAVLEENVTEAGTFVGTPRYMAPEQFDGTPINARVDQFSLCTVLFEGVFGEAPWRGSTGAAIHTEMMDGPPEQPSNEAVPRFVRAVIRRGLAPRAAQRFAGMNELLDALTPPPPERAAAPSRSRWLAPLAVAAVVIPATVWIASRGSDGTPACDGVGERVTEIWNADARTALTTAFRATSLPYAETAISGAIGTLDDYANEWSAAATSACLLGAQEEWSGQAAARAQSSCLELRLGELAQIVELLAHADAAAVESAVDATGALTPISWCDDVERGVAQSEELLPLRLELARAKTLGRLGRVDEARVLAIRVADGAERRGASGLRSEALVAIGATEQRPEIERRYYEDAFWLALGAGDDENAMLAAIVSVERSRDESARDSWRRRAGALVARLGTRPEAAARLAAALGTAADRQGRSGLAVVYLSAAISTLGALADREPLFAMQTWSSLAQSSSRTDPDAGVAAYSIALDIARTRLGALHPVTLRMELGMALGRASRQEFGLAISQMRATIAAYEASPGAPTADEINTRRALGETLAFAGQHKEGLAQLLRADEAQPSATSKVAAALDRAIGTALIFDGRPREAIPVLQRALAREQRMLGEDHSDLSMTLNRLAFALETGGDIEGAMRAARRAAEVLSRSGENLGTALQLTNLAVLAGKLGDHRIAVTYVQRAIALQLESRPPDARLCFPLRILGLELLALERPRDAIPPLERALVLHGVGQVDAGELPKTQLALARALWDGAGDRERARGLAGDARDHLARTAPTSVELVETEAWLRTHADE